MYVCINTGPKVEEEITVKIEIFLSAVVDKQQLSASVSPIRHTTQFTSRSFPFFSLSLFFLFLASNRAVTGKTISVVDVVVVVVVWFGK